ncbi:hypothetical protein PUN28_016774 [Cardiocondyla obscurior]|uniref:Uncharacterized protein n=1 Tax=Cardiocondyla obscurior TaxID=286306 RepID=A0AAW2ESE9_9HYME
MQEEALFERSIIAVRVIFYSIAACPIDRPVDSARKRYWSAVKRDVNCRERRKTPEAGIFEELLSTDGKGIPLENCERFEYILSPRSGVRTVERDRERERKKCNLSGLAWNRAENGATTTILFAAPRGEYRTNSSARNSKN